MQILDEIRNAEERAAQIRASAAAQARDMVASLEEITAGNEKRAAYELRQRSQRELAEAGEAVRAEINASMAARDAEREAMTRRAMEGVDAAAKAIFDAITGE